MTTASTMPSAADSAKTDPLQLIDVDHVRFYVGNAKQAAFFYAHTFGFQIDQIADLTTGSRDEARLPAHAGQHPPAADDAADQGPPGRGRDQAVTATASRTSR